MLFPSQQHITVENLVIGNITAVTTLVVSVLVTGQQFAAGDDVHVTPRVAAGLTNGIAIYGVVIDATHIGIAFVNASAGAIDPADTFDFDIYVTKKSGQAVAGTAA